MAPTAKSPTPFRTAFRHQATVYRWYVGAGSIGADGGPPLRREGGGAAAAASACAKISRIRRTTCLHLQTINTPSTSRLHESARSWRNGHETAAAAGAHDGGLPALLLPASTPQNTALGSLVRHVCPTRRLSTPLSSRSPPPRASSIAILRLPALASRHGQPPPSLVSRGVGRVQGRMCGFAPAHDTHRRCWRPA